MKWWFWSCLADWFDFLAGRSPLSRGAGPVVAVMPFRDLSGGKSSVGEAIRETVTTDLKDVAGLTVVERGAIDKILDEQHLQSSRAELDPLSTVRVGKLLGATLIVTGAYQRAGSSLRLTARFVRVETGEVIGTAKCDGAAGEFLALQDRVTVELLRSAGMQKHVERFARRERPRLKSLRTMELYGDAMAEPDEGKRAGMLKLALNEDPTFEYAVRDLDALEKRLAVLERVQRAAEGQKLDELRRQIAQENDAAKRSALQMQFFGQLVSARRWLTVRREARALLAGPVQPAIPPYALKSGKPLGAASGQLPRLLRSARRSARPRSPPSVSGAGRSDAARLPTPRCTTAEQVSSARFPGVRCISRR